MPSRNSERNRQRLRTLLIVLSTALIVAPAAAFASNSFTDVTDSDFYHDAVDWMADNGVTVGCNPPDNTRYCPDQSVTRGEMAVFLERLDSENVFLRPGDVPTSDDGGGDADTLDGKDSTAFLGADDKAADADTLDGKDSSQFLQATGQAVDADKVDGKDSTEFAGRLFAVVAADGTLERGSRVLDTSKYATGIYSVVFDRVVEDCAFIATIAEFDPGSITVSSDRPDGVYIDTEDLNGADADRPFHLWVIC